jgi:iron complex outermembrane receptor protein
MVPPDMTYRSARMRRRVREAVHEGGPPPRLARRTRAAATVAAALAAIVPAAAASAQDATSPPPAPPTLPTVEVTVTRERARSPLDVPFAITTARPDSARPGQRHQSLDETLLLIPGVTAASRNNPTQDPRLALRGFGARSNFGVRGVRVLRDGIPLTLPDGQTPVDYMDLETIGAVEVIRGSASALYGNAGGGVIDFRSAAPPSDPLAGQARALVGDFGLQRYVGTAGGSRGPLRYQGTLTQNAIDGYRQYSRQRYTNGFGRALARAGRTELQLQTMLFDMPVAQNPGALTAVQFDTNPRMADPLSLQKRARKAVRQAQVGLSATRPLARGGELTALAYGGQRSLDNPLTGFIVDINRHSYGASVRGSAPAALGSVTNTLSAGVDVQQVVDDRKNFANCNGDTTLTCRTLLSRGAERGAVRLDQRETVTGVGPFVRDEVEFATRYRLSAGARADYVRFKVADQRQGIAPAASASGTRTLRAVSPMAGLVVRLGLLHALYANVSSAFETPTTNELANKPDGSPGINPDLKPQYSTTYETGLKGVLLARVRYDVAAFATRVRDELVPYEAVDALGRSTGRSYYRNAGRTARRGAELGLATSLGPAELALTYDYFDFKFTTYGVDSVTPTRTVVRLDYSGNRIPGVPIQQLQAAATWHYRTLFATVEEMAWGGRFVNDANSERAPSFAVTNVRLGGTAIFGKPWLSPVVGVQNLFDRTYAGSINLNAAGRKYYEPAPGRAVYGGLTLGVGR